MPTRARSPVIRARFQERSQDVVPVKTGTWRASMAGEPICAEATRCLIELAISVATYVLVRRPMLSLALPPPPKEREHGRAVRKHVYDRFGPREQRAHDLRIELGGDDHAAVGNSIVVGGGRSGRRTPGLSNSACSAAGGVTPPAYSPGSRSRMVDSITPGLVRKTARDRSPSYLRTRHQHASVIDLLWYEAAEEYRCPRPLLHIESHNPRHLLVLLPAGETRVVGHRDEDGSASVSLRRVAEEPHE